MLGLHLGGAGQFFRDGGEDLDALDGVDAEVAFQIHVGVDGVRGVTGLIGDDSEKNRQDLGRRRIMGNADDGRGDRHGRGNRDAFGQIGGDLF